MEKKTEIILTIIFTLLIIIGLILLTRLVISSAHAAPDRVNYCKLNYGDKWFYDYEEYFGMSCVKPNHKDHTVKRIYFDDDKFKEFCILPKYWDWGDWGGKC